MSKNIVKAPANTKLSKIIDIMTSNRIGSIVITQNNIPASVITEREIIREIIIRGEFPANISAEDIISPSFVTIEPSMSMESAANEMLSKKGRLLVFDNNELVGVLTVTDLIKAFAERKDNPDFKDTASMHIYQAPSDETVESVIKTMHKKRIGSIFITEDDLVSSIFTERDLLEKVLKRGEDLKRRVGDFASKPLISIPLDSGAHEAATMMSEKKIKRLPLKSNDEIVGIVTARDIVETYAKNLMLEV
jgi:CBS domain-containing protein